MPDGKSLGIENTPKDSAQTGAGVGGLAAAVTNETLCDPGPEKAPYT